ncbi:DUF3073 family protein [Demequina sediminicola]|uniref:DUF3073 family protein n=1 Tax=Demequina sediminicola TaxID=1095026 RepID=UPI000783B122|nr:DUF3073 family protein [Demequina sediminicola]
MGRGRQKAKDAKIARQLKYSNHGADLRDLERELISGTESQPSTPDPVSVEETDEYIDRWAEDDDR